MDSDPFSLMDTPENLYPRRDFIRLGLAAGSGLVFAPSLLRAQTSTPANDLNVALVGVGLQGRTLMESMLNIPNVRIKAVCDIWEYSRTYGERYLQKNGHQAAAYSDYQDMLSKEKDLDAVFVATPDVWHAPISNDCMKAGLAVYCEKMMSNTLDGAKSIVKTMKETGKLCQIGHQRRSNPRYIFALNRLLQEANLLGRINHSFTSWNRAVTDDLGWPKKYEIPADVLKKYGYEDMFQFRNWRWFKSLGGGPMSDLGAHQIDIINWFLGTIPSTVMAGGGVDYYATHEWFDNVMAIYEYPTKAGLVRGFSQVLTTTSSGGGYYEQLMGTEGTLKLAENPKWTQIFKEASPDWKPWEEKNYLRKLAAPAAEPTDTKVDSRETAALVSYDIPITLDKPIHQPHVENFLLAVRGEGQLNCPADEALRSEFAIFKTNEAVEAKKMITLNEADLVV